MQNYNVLQPTSLISRDRQTINNNFESVASNFSGTFFPTNNLVDNMLCYRTDLQKMYQYKQSTQQWVLVYDMSNGNCHVAEATTAQKATNDANGNNIANTYMKNANIVNQIMKVIYPVGSIYITATNTNPGTFLGGTWQQIASGRTLIGAGGGYNAGSTGGSEKATGTVGGTALTVAQLPAHSHTGSTSSNGDHTHTRGTMNITGFTAGFPYDAENMFARDTNDVNGPSGAFYPRGTSRSGKSDGRNGTSVGFDASRSWTGSTSTAGAHTHTVSVGNTGSGGTHTHSLSSIDVRQPYLVVYYWQRIS